MQNRTLFFGDNLEILREKIPDEIFDLVYLDPPFNSKRDYNVLFKEGLQDSQAQIRAFEDSWHWTKEAENIFEELIGVKKSETKINQNISDLIQALEKIVGRNDVLAYLVMMTVRLIELQRVLKKTGSIYLHCDPTASHYLKIVMDTIFGKQNFRNELIWAYTGPSGAKKDFPRKHDIIFRYTKTDDYFFNPDAIKIPYSESFLKRRAYSEGKAGIFKEREEHRQEEFIEGKIPADWWDDIPSGGQVSSKERLGYPTQKPEKLLERIIKASSNEGDFVLDPFCGCGTTVAVAERLKRKWVGIDITMLAINLIKKRLHDHFRGRSLPIFIDGVPKDLAGARALAQKDRFEFEYWALDLVEAMPAQSKTKENMKGADKGIDGIITIVSDIKDGKEEYGKLLVQVKSGNVQRNDIATLKGDIERERAVSGVFITLEDPSKPMMQESVMAGTYKVNYAPNKEFPKIQIMTVKELLVGKKPDIPLWTKPYHKEAKKVEEDQSDKQLGFGL